MAGSWNVEETDPIVIWGQENVQSGFIELMYSTNSYHLAQVLITRLAIFRFHRLTL